MNRRNCMSRLFNLFLLSALVTSFAGCEIISPFSAIQGVVDLVIYWKEGEARKYYTGDVEYVYEKFKLVCEDMGQKIEKDTKNRKKQHLIYTKSENNKFKIHVYQADPKIVCVKVRMNT